MLLQVTPHLRPTCGKTLIYIDKLLEIPLINKHLDMLPNHLKQSQSEKKLNQKNQLMKTIKLFHDSKDNIDL